MKKTNLIAAIQILLQAAIEDGAFRRATHCRRALASLGASA